MENGSNGRIVVKSFHGNFPVDETKTSWKFPSRYQKVLNIYGEFEETIITKHIPGDVTAQIFWLKNRKPEYWGGGRGFTEENNEDVQFYLPDNGRDKKDDSE